MPQLPDCMLLGAQGRLGLRGRLGLLKPRLGKPSLRVGLLPRLQKRLPGLWKRLLRWLRIRVLLLGAAAPRLLLRPGLGDGLRTTP